MTPKIDPQFGLTSITSNENSEGTPEKSGVPSLRVSQLGRVGLELQSSTTIPTNDLQNLHSDGAAKSGAVASEPALNGANSDVLAALVAVLTPEQRATLAKLLGG